MSTTTVNAFAVTTSHHFQQVQYDVDTNTLKEYEVFVRIAACGICHTDFTVFGIKGQVPGHEMVGIVEAVGPNSQVSIGQRVGLGWQRNSCHECRSCKKGWENLCSDRKTFRDGYGGYADGVVWDSRFVYVVPDEIKTEHAGPLFCAGATVYSALKHYNKDADEDYRVAVLGIGGLGHLGLQFARAFGWHVTALSGSPNKEQEAKEFGAHDFINTNDPEAVKGALKSFDFILNTVSGDVDWNLYMSMLRPHGKLCIVGIPKNKINVDGLAFIAGSRSLVGSLVASPAENREMLSFVAKHGIRPKTEILPMDSVENVEAAVDKVEKNTARYRVVITTKYFDK
ncbi:adhA [Acrasis kona]|uniref:AdhA n=1 Tax=Acrasis kona TaxID=1008807 RepID=A0AAW2ZKJ6_9EUKA